MRELQTLLWKYMQIPLVFTGGELGLHLKTTTTKPTIVVVAQLTTKELQPKHLPAWVCSGIRNRPEA